MVGQLFARELHEMVKKNTLPVSVNLPSAKSITITPWGYSCLLLFAIKIKKQSCIHGSVSFFVQKMSPCLM
jgi:hypothetical protein